MTERPVPAKNWKEHWAVLSDGEGGGQGDVKIVRPLDGEQDQRFFLKILRQQGDPSRRSRMYREVSAYRTLHHQGIPKLVDSNADAYEDLSFKLFLVTEYIPGQTLQQRIDRGGRLGTVEAIKLAIRLLDIVEHCHSEDIVHRDIKPDNVILRDDSLETPVLVDFGLSFNRLEERGTATEEEVGNRFLRLPELAPMSPVKRDARSDVCFVSGLLLFALTGLPPVQLMNERRQMPHQRDEVRAALASCDDPALIRKLLPILDRAFQLELGTRWSGPAELREELARVLNSQEDDASALSRASAVIKRYTDGPSARAVATLSKKLGDALHACHAEQQAVAQKLGGHFAPSQTGFGVDGSGGRAQTMLGFKKVGDGGPVQSWITFRITVVGDELVVSAEQGAGVEEVHRTLVASPAFDASFKSAMEALFMQHIAAQLEASEGPH